MSTVLKRKQTWGIGAALRIARIFPAPSSGSRLLLGATLFLLMGSASLVTVSNQWLGDSETDQIVYWLGVSCYFIASVFSFYFVIFLRMYRDDLQAIFDNASKGHWEIPDGVMSSIGRSSWIPGMVRNMNRLHGYVIDSAQRLFADSKAVSQGTTQLSSTAEDVAAMLEETASGMEQFSATIEVGSENARSAQVQAEEVTQLLNAGSVNITELIHALEQSVSQSSGLSEVLAVIEDIASQTGMLALNASIEAARAGDSGRGFSTVASEIRELSLRSGEASRSVKSLLESAHRGIADSASIANEVSSLFEQINHLNIEAARAVADIAAASNEQQAGVSQIKTTIEEMASLTQNNAASVDGAARTANELEILAYELDSAADSIGGRTFGQKELIVEMARRARDHLLRVGSEQAFKDFSDSKGAFWKGDLFVVVNNSSGITQFSAAMKKLEGRCVFDILDSAGVSAMKRAMEQAQTEGEGWATYRIAHPLTGNTVQKDSLLVSIPGTENFIVVGAYQTTA